jgi:pyruvyltransferase
VWRLSERSNFGDELGPWLLRRLGLEVAESPEPAGAILSCGSIIALAQRGSVIWGSGIIDSSDSIRSDLDIRAVRGPLTRIRAVQCGAKCPEVYGDPALLLPRVYRPSVVKSYPVGVVPHWVDYEWSKAQWSCPVIDVTQPIEQVIDAICSCRSIISSSLHGLIVAHAYGIPALWAEYKPSRLYGDGVKFRDYLLSVGIEPYAPPDMGELDETAFVPPQLPSIDLEPLLAAIP